MPPDQLANILRGLQPRAMAAGRALAATYDFSAHRTLLDAGGGSGGLAVALTEVCPQLTATVVDLPSVTPITRAVVEEAGASGRVRVEAADLLAGPLAGSYDVAVLRSVIQVLAPEEAARALAHVAQAIRPGGVIYLLGIVLDNSRLGPREAVMENLAFLNIYDGGRAFTEAEYRGWLVSAGFEEITVRWASLPDGTSVVVARRRAQF